MVLLKTKSMVTNKKQEQQWQAESDAQTMAMYQEILSDKARMNRAIKEANKQAQALNKRASAMKSAANIKVGRSSTKK